MTSALGVVAVVLVLAGFVAFVAEVPLPLISASHKEQTVSPPEPLKVELVPGMPHTLSVPEEVRVALGIRKGKAERTAVATVPTRSRPLVLSGSTALDPTRLMRIRARFAPAEVVQIGQVAEDPLTTRSGRTEFRELRSGDRVKKGDLLGVFYSVDVGQKKNDLIDALIMLRLDQDLLERAEKAAATGAVPEVFVRNAERNVRADHNNIERALNTLKTWGIPEEDIQAVYDEAEQALKRKGQKRDRDKERQWARVVLRAPDDGTIVERNVAVHETVVDNTINLFQIAKLDRILVLANAPEDQLPTLLKLGTDQRRWTVCTVDTPPEAGITGPIDDISYLIDVNQHAAVVKGYIDNPGERLRAGQYITARIELPPPEGVVEIPMSALVDDGKQCVVFIQPDEAKPQYTLRRVQVTHRFNETAFVRSRLTDEEKTLTSEEREQGLLPRQPLRAGERVLTAGVLELKKELEDRESNSEN
jgi:cobalt-zinc-cadmium efflux system membrane fusion protein